MARPFTQRVKRLRDDGMRYIDLARGCDEARSSAWFNNLVNSSDPWVVNPPTADTFDGLSTLLRTTIAHLREMIAEEWYGIAPADTGVSERVQTLAPLLDTLPADDFRLVEDLVQRLQRGEPSAA